MNIKHFSNDVQTLARSQRSGDSHVLKTPSGKLKENTLFERTLGLGKQLIAKISGNSYELKRISLNDGKTLIQDRFNAQLRFFSGKKNFDASAKTELKNSGDKFLNSLLNSDIIFSNPKKALESKITESLTTINNEGPEKTAFQRLESLYSQKNSSAGFTAAAREFDSLRGTNGNAVVSDEQITFTENFSLIAERAHKQGASKNNSYCIARLTLNSTAFSVLLNEDERYEIAVSTLMQSFERGVYSFDKMEEILPLKSKEALAVKDLLDIRDDLRKISRSDSSHNTVNKNTSRTENNSSADKKSGIDQKEFRNLLTRALNDGATNREAQFFASLMVDNFPQIPKDQKERQAPVMSTLMIAHNNNIKEYAKLKEIFVLKYAEANAESKLREIRRDIDDVLSSKPSTT